MITSFSVTSLGAVVFQISRHNLRYQGFDDRPFSINKESSGVLAARTIPTYVDTLHNIGPLFAIILGVMTLMTIYIQGFSTRVYPHLPQQLGGGRPRNAYLIYKQEGLLGLRELGLPASEDSSISPRVELLWEGDDVFVIKIDVVNDSPIFVINKDVVSGFVLDLDSTAKAMPPSPAPAVASPATPITTTPSSSAPPAGDAVQNP